MYVKRGGKLVKITKKSINAVSPSTLKLKRVAFERKKKTEAFRRWRIYQYKVIQKGRCYYCERPIVGALVTDHVIPLFRGGASAYRNLVITCWRCNDRKGIRLVSEKNL
jgi:5-methylcytosine-specific restriction endonuclease McrA